MILGATDICPMAAVDILHRDTETMARDMRMAKDMVTLQICIHLALLEHRSTDILVRDMADLLVWVHEVGDLGAIIAATLRCQVRNCGQEIGCANATLIISPVVTTATSVGKRRLILIRAKRQQLDLQRSLFEQETGTVFAVRTISRVGKVVTSVIGRKLKERFGRLARMV